jgi:hypothetical protein
VYECVCVQRWAMVIECVPIVFWSIGCSLAWWARVTVTRSPLLPYDQIPTKQPLVHTQHLNKHENTNNIECSLYIPSTNMLDKTYMLIYYTHTCTRSCCSFHIGYPFNMSVNISTHPPPLLPAHHTRYTVLSSWG